MTCFHKRGRCILLWMVLILLSGMMLVGFTPSVQAAREERRDERAVPGYREFRDARYHHDRFYPARGHVIRALPRDHRVVVHGRSRYYFSGGVWYRPHGPRFVVVMPPFGLFVPFLPPYYATVWVGGIPYYYANEVYYAHRGDGYVVVEPPKGESARRRRRWTRCSSIPAWARAKSNRRTTATSATVGP